MKKIDKRVEVGELVFTSKYARTVNGRKESWDEAVSRVMEMHYNYISPNISAKAEFNNIFSIVWAAYSNQEILGAQRALQFGGDQLLKHHTRMYNCSSSYADRPRFFQELMYILLCGAGAGYSVQKVHVDKLPAIKEPTTDVPSKVFVIPDTIEGWADSIGELVNSFFYGTEKVIFDFSKIRPKGAFISGGFKAPGHEPLKEALDKIREVLKSAVGRKLRSFEVDRIACLLADAVISGGIRRSALLCLFDTFDEEMLTCKTGNWWHTNPELARSNNSAVILPHTSKELYKKVFKSSKEFGEPGFAFLKSPHFGYNPLIIAA